MDTADEHSIIPTGMTVREPPLPCHIRRRVEDQPDDQTVVRRGAKRHSTKRKRTIEPAVWSHRATGRFRRSLGVKLYDCRAFESRSGGGRSRWRWEHELHEPIGGRNPPY